MLRNVSILLAIAAVYAGVVAVRKWYVSSKITPLGLLRYQLAEPEIVNKSAIVSTWRAINDMIEMNKVAALWSVISEVCAAASAIIGILD